jgi:hypothetical protein
MRVRAGAQAAPENVAQATLSEYADFCSTLALGRGMAARRTITSKIDR